MLILSPRALQGITPSGRKITIRSVAQRRVEAGRIVEDWVIVETLGWFQQLEIVQPTPELPPKRPS